MTANNRRLTFRERIDEFLFPRVSDSWITALRIGLSLQILIYCLSLVRDWTNLFLENGQGLISRDLEEALLNAYSVAIPRIGWLVKVGTVLGLSEANVLWIVWGGLFLAAVFLLAGFFCRTAAIACWFLHLCAAKSSALLGYGVDNFTTIGLFYLALSPLPDRLTLDCYFRGKETNALRCGFVQRLLQLHLCVIYFFGGLTKCLSFSWWDGSSLWRSLTCPPFNLLPMEVVLKATPILPIGGIAIWLLELFYPVFIWVKKTRFMWLLSIVAMHFAIAATMGLYVFGFIMIVLNTAAFGTQYIGLQNVSLTLDRLFRSPPRLT